MYIVRFVIFILFNQIWLLGFTLEALTCYKFIFYILLTFFAFAKSPEFPMLQLQSTWR
jgi:hypothetical protein